MEARAQPLRGRPDSHVTEDAADVARAAHLIVDRDVDSLGIVDGRVRRVRLVELTAQKGGDLPREADHGEQVDAIHRRLDVEDAVGDREHVRERRTGLERVGQHA